MCIRDSVNTFPPHCSSFPMANESLGFGHPEIYFGRLWVLFNSNCALCLRRCRRTAHSTHFLGNSQHTSKLGAVSARGCACSNFHDITRERSPKHCNLGQKLNRRHNSGAYYPVFTGISTRCSPLESDQGRCSYSFRHTCSA